MSQVKDFVQRIKDNSNISSMFLILFPLFFLVFAGIISNNFAASGVNVNNLSPLTGNPYPCIQSPTCPLIWNPPNSPCVSNPSFCDVTKTQTFQFLSPNSPFTYALQGNLVGFLFSAFGIGEYQNTFQIGETICFPLINGKIMNATGNGIQNFECFGDVRYNNVTLPTVLPPLNATSNIGNASLWTLTGCPSSHLNINPHCGIGYNSTQAIVAENAFYIRNGTILQRTFTCTVLANFVFPCSQLRVFLSTPVFQCPSTSSLVLNGTNYAKSTTYYCLIPYTAQNQANLGASFGFFAFVAGIILLIMGLGLNLTAQVVATGATLGINPQGTRLAQVFGIGLVVFGFITSEFTDWLSTLPYNSGLIIYSMLGIMFFTGLYWRTFSLD